MRKAIKMKQIVFYCSGRNELPPPRIDGIQFFPERASMWDELSKRLPDVSISVWFTPPGEFAVDMGNIQTNETVSAYKPVRSPERVAYRFLDGTESVEEIAGKIAETHPDVAVAFSIPIMPYDWSALRDAMVGEELRRRGIKTISHSTRFALESFQKEKCTDFLRRNGFNVAGSIMVQNSLFHVHVTDPSIPQNAYREFIFREIRKLRFPVVIKPTVFSGAVGFTVSHNFDDAVKVLDEWKLDSDILVEEQIDGEIFGIEIYGAEGHYHVTEPVIFSVDGDATAEGLDIVKEGPVTDEKYHIPHLKAEMIRMSDLYGLNGFAQADLIFSQGKWYIIEINPRYTLMSDISAAIEGKDIISLYGELATGQIGNAKDNQRSFAIDFKTRLLDREEICRLCEKYSCIVSVMRVQTAVSSVGSAEYCEFVMAGEEQKKLRSDMRAIKGEIREE